MSRNKDGRSAHKDKGKDHIQFERFLGNLANVITVVGTASTLFATIRSVYKQSLIWAVSAFLLLAATCIFIFAKVHIRDLVAWLLGLSAPDLPYSFSSWDALYEYKDLNNMEFTAIYTVKPLQSGVDNIRVRYNWTGATDGFLMTPLPLTDISKGIHTSKVVFDGKEYGYDYYRVYSPTSHNKRDEDFLVGTNIKLKNGVKCSHHLLTSISVKTSHLTMRVILPDGLEPIAVNFFEYLHATDDVHWHTKPLKPKFNVQLRKWEIVHDVENPIFGGKYLISWDFQK